MPASNRKKGPKFAYQPARGLFKGKRWDFNLVRTQRTAPAGLRDTSNRIRAALGASAVEDAHV